MKIYDGLRELIVRIPQGLTKRKKRIWPFLKQQRKKWIALGPPTHYIWILGCQRSGTTLMEKMFRNDLNSVVFSEYSSLTIAPRRMVLKPFLEVKNIIAGRNARYAVVRPLVESERVKEIIEYFPQSTVIWMFREPHYVVDSMMNKWGPGFFDDLCSVDTDVSGKWRQEELYEEIKQEARRLTGTDKRIEDLYALYWLKRNEIIVDPGLCRNPQILFLNYSRQVSAPKYCIDVIMQRAMMRGVWKYFSIDAHRSSLTRKVTLTLSPGIQEHCDALHHKLCEFGNRDFP